MTDSEYQSATIFDAENESSFDATKVILKRDTRLIRLQQVKYDISSFNTMRIYIAIIFLLITLQVFVELLQFYPELPGFVDVISICQLIGYGYGFQAHSSRSRLRVLIFFYYAILSFGITVYFFYWLIMEEDWVAAFEDAVNIILNILLLIACKKYLDLLKERDHLKKFIADSSQIQIEPY